MARLNKSGLVFFALGAGLSWLGLRASNPVAGLLGLSAGLCFLGLGAIYFFRWPGLLGKTTKGRLVTSSYVLFWPYHLLGYASLFIARILSVEPFQEVAPGLYLGGRLFPWEEPKLKQRGIKSVLDLTCELSEVGFLRQVPGYRCIPLLDGGAPSAAELEASIDFITERLRSGPVYVHCAMGHGRSATVIAGYLVASGKTADLRAAMELVRSKRPGIRLNAGQRKSLCALKS
jgi:hypothetical protein